MKVEQKVLDKFKLLIDDGRDLLNTLTFTQQEVAELGENASGRLDNNLAIKWELRCLHFLKQLCSEQHTYYKVFNSLCNNNFSVRPYLAEDALIILETAKEDYESGDLVEFRTLIEAEVFDEFLEQAEELFKKGYYQAAAVIAGCVLEDGLRKLCDRNSITLPAKATIEPINVELARAGIYSKLVQKKITALADLRNKAAHGEWTEFTPKDVEDMIRAVRRFMEDYFS